MKTIGKIEGGISEGLSVHHIEAFLETLRTAQYAERTLSKKRWILTAFARWMKNKNIALANLDESKITKFVNRSRGALVTRVQFECAVLRLLFAYLRGEAIVRLPNPEHESAIDLIYDRCHRDVWRSQ